MKLTKTYHKGTALAWLSNATVQKMQAGNVEIVLREQVLFNPASRDARYSSPIIGELGSRTTDWGDTQNDVLLMTTVHGIEARLLCGSRALRKLEQLTAEVERQQKAVQP